MSQISKYSATLATQCNRLKELMSSQDKHKAGTRICWLSVTLLLFISFSFVRDFHLQYFQVVFFVSSLYFSKRYFHFTLHTWNTLTCPCTSTHAIIKSDAYIISDTESLSVPLLTRLMRRLIAYSCVQMHSQGSKPPSAISYHTVSTLEPSKSTACNQDVHTNK